MSEPRHITAPEAEHYYRRIPDLAIQRAVFRHWRVCPACRALFGPIEKEQVMAPLSTAGVCQGGRFRLHWTQPWPVVVIADETGLISVDLDAGSDEAGEPENGLPVNAEDHYPVWLREFRNALPAYCNNGRPLPFFPVRWARIGSLFQRRALFWVSLIPHGETASYAEIAAWMGCPGAARAVGGAMRANPFPLVIPCHRVIGASGRLVGFGGGLTLKQTLLNLETG